jgi:hypothetical protein
MAGEWLPQRSCQRPARIDPVSTSDDLLWQRRDPSSVPAIHQMATLRQQHIVTFKEAVAGFNLPSMSIYRLLPQLTVMHISQAIVVTKQNENTLDNKASRKNTMHFLL